MKKWMVPMIGLALALAAAGVISAFTLGGDGPVNPDEGTTGAPLTSSACEEYTPDCDDTIVVPSDTSEGGDEPGAGIAVGEPHPSVSTDDGPIIEPEPGDPKPPVEPGFATVTVPAPIESVEVIVLESFPPQYNLVVISGLPNGCVSFEGYAVARDGDTILVAVNNLEPEDAGARACTKLYGFVRTSIPLGSDFESGKTYTVMVNDVIETFVAQ